MSSSVRVLPISVFIIARDEADRIARCIESVKGWVEEIIVVDSGSQDDTVRIAKALGAKVIEKDWPGYGAQRRFAEEQCKNPWVLNLDADESLSPELIQEIKEIFSASALPPENHVYEFKIHSIYPWESKLCRFPYTLRAVRIYNTNFARCSPSPIHDRVEFTNPPVWQTLRGSVYHHSIRSLSHLVAKTNQYTDEQAVHFLKRGRHINPLRLLIEYPVGFFVAYIGRGHILRGWSGFILAQEYAFRRFMRLAKMWEAEKRQST